MKSAICRLGVFILAFCIVGNVWSRDLSGQWDLKIEDKRHNVISVLVIKFSARKAKSCIGGNWLRVDVVSSTTKDASFFPVSDALSYSIENSQLIIGRNEICDAYLRLRGKLDDEIIRGEYFGGGHNRSAVAGCAAG